LVGLGALAAPALAKGPVETASGQVVITGPGLPGGSIEVNGTVKGFQEPGSGFMPFEAGSEGEFSELLFASAMLSGADSEQGWFVLQPENLRSIGPAYQLRLDMAGEEWSQTVTRQLYPFAPERPLIFTPAESITIAAPSRMQTLRGLWWSAPPTLLGILRSHGLPLTAPREVARPAPIEVAAPHPQGWVVLWTGLALLGLLVAGVLAGRRKVRLA
jgi:hypothetical protein